MIHASNKIQVPAIDWHKIMLENWQNFLHYTPFGYLTWYENVAIILAILLPFWLWFEWNYLIIQ